MSHTAIGGMPLVPMGQASRPDNIIQTPSATPITLAATKAAAIFIGHIFTDDGLSHTLNTGGSSALGWDSGAVTFANAGTTVVVGLGAVDTANGPPARAANSTGTITFSVSKSLVGGGGGITASAWQSHVPDSGTLAVANGDFIAMSVQMTVRAGADSVVVNSSAVTAVPSRPVATLFDGTSTYTGQSAVPNAVITFSDGHLGFFFGGHAWSTSASAQTWNNTSPTKEYGNYFNAPFNMQVYGLLVAGSFGGDTDLILYETPLGAPSAAKTISVDLNTIGVASQRLGTFLFATPYSYVANTDIAVIMKPTSSTNVTLNYTTLNASAYQKSMAFGTNGYAVNRNTVSSGTPFTAQNSSKDRFCAGLLVGAFDSSTPVGQQCM